MMINLSNDKQDSKMLEDDDAIDLGKDMLEEHEEEEDLEAEIGGDAISLVGIQLGGIIACKEHIVKFARARFQGTHGYYSHLRVHQVNRHLQHSGRTKDHSNHHRIFHRCSLSIL